MRFAPMRFSFPLLSKDLIELSAHKRTYIFRTIFAIILYGTAILGFRQELGSFTATGLSIFGQGRRVYLSLAVLEFTTIFLFLPAMTSGALTAEKERDTLGLLLITKLGPWTIVFEKLLSRLIPMGMYLLLSLPLLAIAYGLGGIELADLAKLMYVLFVTTLQVGSFSILCSAWFRTTATSFLGTYLLGAIATVVWGLAFEFTLVNHFQSIVQSWLSIPSQTWLFSSDARRVAFLAFGPLILNGAELAESFLGDSTLRNQTFSDCLVMSLPLLGTSLFNLVVARLILWKRAFTPAENRMSKPIARIDRFFRQLNRRFLKLNFGLIEDSDTLPYEEPITWRDTHRGKWGSTGSLLQFLILLEGPLFFTMLIPVSEDHFRAGHAPVFIGGWCLWIVATLILTIQSTGLLTSERLHQSMDVLLSLPIESREIIRQKFVAVWRMIRMMWIPFTTLCFFQILWISVIFWQPDNETTTQINIALFMVLRSAFSMTIHLPTIALAGFFIGLRFRMQPHAIFVVIAMITFVCIFPTALAWSLMPNSSLQFQEKGINQFAVRSIQWISPITALSAIPRDEDDWLLLYVHFSTFAVTGILLYWRLRFVNLRLKTQSFDS
jgi:hypothetical protein